MTIEKTPVRSIRQPAVAGMFYPADRTELHRMVTDMLSHADEPLPNAQQPVAVIAPHAGYIYSGPVAATAYRYLTRFKDQIKRVILLGPSHRIPLSGLAMSSASHFATPLGLIPIDHDSYRRITNLPAVKLLDAAHLQEHSLEVHLPFLQTVLDDFLLVPLVVGDASKEQVANVLKALDPKTDTLIVVSSDLSHYHDYRTARQRDQHTSDAIVHLQPENIGYEDACGRNPVNGLLLFARDQHLQVQLLDLRNSGDTAGPHERVVGYGAYLVN